LWNNWAGKKGGVQRIEYKILGCNFKLSS
jgi:hypothetical protein